MSFFHYLHIGHLDKEALRQRRLAIARPLDMDRVGKIFAEMGGTTTSEGKAILGGQEFLTEDKGDCLVCLLPVRNLQVAEFIYQVAKQTGCDIATVEGGGGSPPEEFLARYQRKFAKVPTAPQPAASA